MPNRNTIVVPCMVKSRLKVSGGTICSADHASCSRIMDASRPAIARKKKPTATYMIPSRLWSTVVTQSWSRSSVARGAAAAPGVAVGDRTLMGGISSECHEIRGQGVQIAPGQLHRRHQRALLEG